VIGFVGFSGKVLGIGIALVFRRMMSRCRGIGKNELLSRGDQCKGSSWNIHKH